MTAVDLSVVAGDPRTRWRVTDPDGGDAWACICERIFPFTDDAGAASAARLCSDHYDVDHGGAPVPVHEHADGHRHHHPWGNESHIHSDTHHDGAHPEAADDQYEPVRFMVAVEGQGRRRSIPCSSIAYKGDYILCTAARGWGDYDGRGTWPFFLGHVASIVRAGS